jgi:hypothetical protein
MAFVSYVDINPADEQQMFKGLLPDSRFLYSKIKKKTTLFSAKKKKAVSQRSLLPQIAACWAGLSDAQKIAWTTAGSYCGLNGWRTFVAEQSIRLKIGYAIPSTPSNFHNAWLGYMSVQSPATQILIAQYHPAGYYVHKKVTGFKKVYAPVFVQEAMSLPLQIGISYICDLFSLNPDHRARFYAVVRSSYQGVDRETTVEINFINDFQWHTAVATLSSVLGYVIGYTLYIELYNYKGDLWFDQVKAIHGAVNWARDKACYDINVTFTNQFYQIPKNWVAIELPDGALYKSDYVNWEE